MGVTPKTEGGHWCLLAGALWLVPFMVITVTVIHRPEKRSVTPLYHAAVTRWASHKALYDGPSGMNYLPTFVPIFAPFHALPLEIAEVLWRGTAMLGLAWGLAWLLDRRACDFPKQFALATLLCVPLCLGAIRNGQANAHLGAALLLAAGALRHERWWTAAWLLALSVALKPLGLAAVGLAFAAYPAMWWRLGITVSSIVALPLVFAPADYGLSQYQLALVNLKNCAEVTEHRFADLNGIFRTFGAPLSTKVSLAVRAGASLVFAASCWLVVRRTEAEERAVGWLAAAAGYLMLFNPMNEANSYVILAPALALWTLRFRTKNHSVVGWTLVGALATMSLLPNLLRPWLGNHFALAWHPFMTAVFLGLLCWWFGRSLMRTAPTPINS